jgi:prophage regulatory protein
LLDFLMSLDRKDRNMRTTRLPANPALNGTSAPAAVFNELNLPQLCRITHLLPILPIGRSTIWLWVRQGRFPEPLKLGSGVTVWRREEVLLWLRQAGE